VRAGHAPAGQLGGRLARMPRFAQPCCDANLASSIVTASNCVATSIARAPQQGSRHSLHHNHGHAASKAPPQQSSAWTEATSMPVQQQHAAAAQHAAPRSAAGRRTAASVATPPSRLGRCCCRLPRTPRRQRVTRPLVATPSPAPSPRSVSSRGRRSEAEGAAAPSAPLSAEPACAIGARKHDTPRRASKSASRRVDGALQARRVTACEQRGTRGLVCFLRSFLLKCSS
jgi:hypothetical protein